VPVTNRDALSLAAAIKPPPAERSVPASREQLPVPDPPPVRRSLQAPPRARHARPLVLKPAEGAADWATPFLALLGVGLLVGALITFGSARWLQQVAEDTLSPGPVPVGLPVQLPVQLPDTPGAGELPVELPDTPVALPGELPVEVKIPAIELAVAVEPLGLNSKRELLPKFGTSGWYNLGPAPGQAGHAAVIAGHVDSHKGPDVFYRLHTVKPGEEVEVRTSTGGIVSFKVDAVEKLPKKALADSAVWITGEQPRLALITCGGKFNKKTRSYADNVVVYATLTGRVDASTSPVESPRIPSRLI